MLKLGIFLCFGLCLSLEGAQCYDEPLSKHQWSHFGPLCKHYVAGRREKPDAVYDALKSYVKSDAAILDLGSGTGISTRQLFKNGFKNVIGVDRDLLMICEAQDANTADCTIKYIRADVSNGLPFPDEEFDVVTAASAFHWFSNPSSIREVERILKPQGYYFIIGAQDRKISSKKGDPIKDNIKQIFKDAGAPPKPNKHAMSTVSALEAQDFKIIFEKQIPYIHAYTKQEYLEHLQSKTSWNLVKVSQRDLVLRKIDHYLDSVLDEQGKLAQEGHVTIVLAQKVQKAGVGKDQLLKRVEGHLLHKSFD